jgi:hypothetical protein
MEKTPRFQGFCCTSALNTFICNQLQITGTFLKNPFQFDRHQTQPSRQHPRLSGREPRTPSM